jgi:ribosomal protein S18 acetylase RimI-like enzyme
MLFSPHTTVSVIREHLKLPTIARGEKTRADRIDKMKLDSKLRTATSSDDTFLFALFKNAHKLEWESMPGSADQKDMIMRMQFMAQESHYRNYDAEMSFDIILLNDESVGRLIVARSPKEIRLVDIVINSEHRGKGLGAFYVRSIVEESKEGGITARLNVKRDNPASALYRRLGFHVTSEDEIYSEMEHI